MIEKLCKLFISTIYVSISHISFYLQKINKDLIFDNKLNDTIHENFEPVFKNY